MNRKWIIRPKYGSSCIDVFDHIDGRVSTKFLDDFRVSKNYLLIAINAIVSVNMVLVGNLFKTYVYRKYTYDMYIHSERITIVKKVKGRYFLH